VAAATNMTKEERVERARTASRAGALTIAYRTVTTRAAEIPPEQRDLMILALRSA
jgi:hypothetical protein